MTLSRLHHAPYALASDLRGSRSCALWHRLLGRPVSESGGLCHGDGGHVGGTRCRRVLILPTLPMLDHRAPMSTVPRYVLTPDPHGRHTTILRWLGQDRSRRLLDVGAAGLLSERMTEQGWRVTAIEKERSVR